jgi:hypothetical protein
MDNINNTIYTILAQHTSIHTATFYLTIIINRDAKVKRQPEECKEEGKPYYTELLTLMSNRLLINV